MEDEKEVGDVENKREDIQGDTNWSFHFLS